MPNNDNYVYKVNEEALGWKSGGKWLASFPGGFPVEFACGKPETKLAIGDYVICLCDISESQLASAQNMIMSLGQP